MGLNRKGVKFDPFFFVNMEFFVGLWEISGNFGGISTILHPWPPE